MKAEELRIGNLLNYQGKEFIVLHVGRGIIGIMIDGETNKFNSLVFSPIPLTEEWHLKFGARKRTDKRFSYKVSENCYFDFIWDKTKFEWWVEYVNGNIISPMPVIIKYVHELQNFWRANTGKELTYK